MKKYTWLLIENGKLNHVVVLTFEDAKKMSEGLPDNSWLWPNGDFWQDFKSS